MWNPNVMTSSTTSATAGNKEQNGVMYLHACTNVSHKSDAREEKREGAAAAAQQQQLKTGEGEENKKTHQNVFQCHTSTMNQAVRTPPKNCARICNKFTRAKNKDTPVNMPRKERKEEIMVRASAATKDRSALSKSLDVASLPSPA